MNWNIPRFSSNNFRSLAEIRDKGWVTRDTQKTYSSNIGYYINIWWFRDMNLVEKIGKHQNNDKWSLTQNGESFLGAVLDAERMIKIKGDDKSGKNFIF